MADKIEVQYQGILPPMQGAIATLTINTTPTVVDLTTLVSGAAATGGSSQPDQKNVIGKYVRIFADGGQIYHAFGNNAALLANINANAVSSIANGALTFNGAECFPIAANSATDEIVVAASPAAQGTPTAQVPTGGQAVCRYVALVMQTGTATARFYQSST
jgi:hypothetical protein